MKKIALLLIFILSIGQGAFAETVSVDALQKFFVYGISAEEDTRIALADFLKELINQELTNENAHRLNDLLPELTFDEACRSVQVFTNRSLENQNGIIDIILYGARSIPYTEYMPGVTKSLNQLIIGDENDNRGINYIYTIISLYNFMSIFGGDSRICSDYEGLPGIVSLKLSSDMDPEVIKKVSGAINRMPTLKERLLDYEGPTMLDKILACAEEIINQYPTPEIYHFKLAMHELGVSHSIPSVVMTNNLYEGLTFRDIDNCVWAHPQIKTLCDNGAVSGTGKYTFSPQDMITREQFVKIAVEAFDITAEDAPVKFSDVKETDWFYPYVKTACNAGIVNGMSETEFGSGSYITREQMAALIYRCCEAAEIDIKKGGNVLFTDRDQISPYARNAVSLMSSAGIITGMGGGMFAPKDNATRAQAAVMICRAME